jgi:hypothetical protein
MKLIFLFKDYVRFLSFYVISALMLVHSILPWQDIYFFFTGKLMSIF